MDAVISWFEHHMEQDGASLVQGLQSRDPEVLDHLIGMYQHRLLRYLLSLTASRSMAEDLFQETWLRVLERGHQYRSQWKFEVWLFSIARHLVIDEARRKKGASLDELAETDEGPRFQPASAGPSPLEEVVAGQEGERIAHHLSRLPAVYREVLILRFREDLALEEIATIITAPLSTVKSRLYRAVETLRRTMSRP
jgi:RNA polymerase sigma-70 factor, ECF subfamily